MFLIQIFFHTPRSCERYNEEVYTEDEDENRKTSDGGVGILVFDDMLDFDKKQIEHVCTTVRQEDMVV